MIIVNKDDISSAVKQAKAMIKPSLLALENSLRFTAKQSRLFIRNSNINFYMSFAIYSDSCYYECLHPIGIDGAGTRRR